MVMAGAECRELVKQMPRTLRVGNLPGGDTEFITIQDAVDYADAQGGYWTILIYPGIYDEGDITNAASAYITLKGVSNQIYIMPTAAPVNAVVVCNDGMHLEDLYVIAPDATAPAVIVVNAIVPTIIRRCHIVGVNPNYSIDMQGGGLEVHESTLTEDVSLSTLACTCDFYHTTFLDDFITAGALAHNVDFISCDFTNGNINSGATGATVITLNGCTYVNTISNAGTGAFVVRESDTVSINQTNAGGSTTIYGGYIDSITRAVGAVVWWQDGNTLKVIPSGTNTDTVIGWALAAAAAGDVVLLHPGTYDEQVTCVAGVDMRAVGTRGSSIIQQTDANVVILADGIELKNFTIRLVTPTVARQLVYDNAAACTAVLEDINFEITTPGALSHALMRFYGAGDYTVRGCFASIGACGANFYTIEHDQNAGVVHLFNNDFIAATGYHIRSGVAGTITGGHNRWAGACHMWNVANGTILMNGDTITTQGDAWGDISGGSVCLKTSPQQYEVVWPMTIQDAITAAAADTPAPAATAPYTVLIHPGRYAELVTCSAYVNVKGIGPRGSVIVYQNDAGGLITYAANVEIENLIVRLGTPTAGYAVTVLNAAGPTYLKNVGFEVDTPGAFTYILVQVLAAGATMTLDGCYYNIGGTGASVGVWNGNNAATIHLINNDCTFSNANAFHLHSTVAGTWTGNNNRWAGTCAMFDWTLGTIDLDHDTILATAAWTLTDSTATLRHCTIESAVTAGNGTIVRLKVCSYRVIARSGTGDIIDETPAMAGYGFRAVDLTPVSLDNIATRTAVGGAAALGGTGQIGLQINDNAADAAGIENNADAAGSLNSSFTAGRTIRYSRMVSVSAFRATTTMFFGLRAALGAAIPGPGEDHFGFDWNGTNFRATSSDGAGVGEQTNLTTPTTGVNVQLEAIQFRTKIEFYVDGVLVATHSTAAGIPTAGGSLDWQEYEISSGAGGATTSDITLRHGFLQECPA